MRWLPLALLVAGCSTAATPVAPPAAQSTVDPGYITKAEYGTDWPFTISAGTLRCYEDGDRIYVTFGTDDGIEYALNGSARDFGFPELDATILTDYPDRSGVLDLIQVGLDLC